MQTSIYIVCNDDQAKNSIRYDLLIASKLPAIRKVWRHQSVHSIGRIVRMHQRHMRLIHADDSLFYWKGQVQVVICLLRSLTGVLSSLPKRLQCGMWSNGCAPAPMYLSRKTKSPKLYAYRQQDAPAMKGCHHSNIYRQPWIPTNETPDPRPSQRVPADSTSRTIF